MPRKPKITPERFNVVVNGVPICVTLHPPTGRQKAWYVYWAGLGNSKSTGERDLKSAIAAAESMLRNGGRRPVAAEGVLSDEEFKEMQRRHFARNLSTDRSKRADSSLKSCLEAIDAFIRIAKLPAISLATPDDCARFEQEALKMPKSWRLSYPRAKRENVSLLSPNTVVKWSTALAAAFERINVNAGKKCIRGVVPESKLLTANPWRKFSPIEAVDKPQRHLRNEELLSMLDYFETNWDGMTALTTAVKTLLWTSVRLAELGELSWDNLRTVGQERHFWVKGKWGVEKWVRVPSGLMNELYAIKTEAAFVFSAYSSQLRSFHLRRGDRRSAQMVKASFSAYAFQSWFSERIEEWVEKTGVPRATAHAFRKTSLQHARRGEDVNQLVANDEKLNEAVMTRHYTTETCEEFRHASNRMFLRIVASLSAEVAYRFGHRPDDKTIDLRKRLAVATASEDWSDVAKLAAELTRLSDSGRSQDQPKQGG